MSLILADKNLYGIEQFLKALKVPYRLYDEQQFNADYLKDVDAWILRTVTKVSHSTLKKANRLKLVFSASAGLDHIDQIALRESEIELANAKGANANAVAEYTFFSIIKIMDRYNLKSNDLIVGIIGAGSVGSAVIRLLKSAKIAYKVYDPPKEARETAFTSCSISSLYDCNILSFHTPLTFEGTNPTYRLFSENTQIWNNQQIGIINTSRGGVVDEEFQYKRLENGLLKSIILDVWEDEPNYNTTLRKQCLLATPHIAGYSFEAKVRASFMAATFIAEKLKVKLEGTFDEWVSKLATSDSEYFKKTSKEQTNEYVLLHKAQYYANLMSIIDDLDQKERKTRFQQLRNELALRREWKYQKMDVNLIERFPLMRVFDG